MTGRIESCRNEAYWETLQYDAAANLLDRRRGEEESNQNLIRFNQLLSFRGLKYSYDEHGRTRSKQTASGTQYYHYDAEHRLTEVRIEQLNHTERYGYVYDALGRRIEKHRLDRDGKPCNRTTFLWDRMQMIQESSADKRQSLRYQGQYLDRETGLHYNTLRYYDSDIGRFTQSDTIGFLGSYNL